MLIFSSAQIERDKLIWKLMIKQYLSVCSFVTKRPSGSLKDQRLRHQTVFCVFEYFDFELELILQS